MRTVLRVSALINNILNKKPIILISVIVLLAFFRLGEHPIEDWDESRHGVNAIEMLQNKDWVNLHYAGKVDDWNLKPPLAIWLIAGSYSIFGTNSWALRIPSALAILFAFFFLCKIIRLYESEEFAFRTCLILTSVKGWIGYHVGRTGDTDAVLVAMLIATTFYFLKYIDFGNKKSVLYSALFFGLAFMTKGLAALVFVPSIFLYTFYIKRLKILFSQKETYQSFLIFLLFPIV